ncbi:MAG: hypothetical protein AAB262_14935, partial [Elusimicrobiota bacterium]
EARQESLESQGGQNPYWVGAQAVLNAGIPGVVGMVRGLFRVDDASKPALEDLLGERLFAVVVEDSTAARAGIDLLKAAGSGRARFLVLSALAEAPERSYPENSRPLLSSLQFDPRHEKIVRHLFAEAYELGGKLFGDHWVYGGCAPKDGAQPTLADLGELKAKVVTLESRGTQLAGERARAESALGEALAAARAAAAALSAESNRAHGLKARVSSLEQSLENHIRNEELSTEESARALAQIAAAKEDIFGAKSVRAEAEARVASARGEESKVSEALNATHVELAGKRAEFAAQEWQLKGVQDQMTAYESSRKRLDDEKNALEASIARLAAEAEQLSQRKSETLASQERMRGEIHEFSTTLAAQENAAKSVFERMQDLQFKIDGRLSLLKTLQAEYDQAQADLNVHQVHAAALKSKQDMLKARLWDEWQMTFADAQAKYNGVVADQERLEMLRRRIAAMGNINMAAPEEHEALAERQRFLIGQINDLLKAKDDLLAAITKINNATRENFRQTFTDVREHFRRLYAVLFEGGEADLVLTDPENILETGVDIVAQPPGKKLQSISLLSGGEKTLTAIALLFAFFMVKPAPFCMLDEADAALDDANIERFVALLREFQNKTQFLIISHNKRTMEATDVMYGVTMEEKGVTQLVSVDFRKKAGSGAESAERNILQQGPFEPAG